jgi:hypothetical protein
MKSLDIDIETNSFTRMADLNENSSNNYDKLSSTFYKIGNCYIFKPSYFPHNIKIVIGPHYYVFPFGILFFIGLEYFLLKNFRHYLPLPIIIVNIAITFFLCFFYILIFLVDPGIIINKKINFDEESAITCDKCLSTINDQAIHCSFCDICTRGCDHHCPWISKCVGKGNLILFYIFVFLGAMYYFVIIFLTGGYFLIYKHLL